MKGCRPLSPQEIEKCIEYLKKSDSRFRCRNLALFTLGLSSAFRMQELLSLRIKDCYHKGKLNERVTVKKANTKGKIASRSMKINKRCQKYLLHYIQDMKEQMGEDFDENNYLFTGQIRKDQPICFKTAWEIYKNMFKELDLTDIDSLSTHTTRKTAAMQIYNKTKKHVNVKDALGHKKIETTMSYLSSNQKEIDDALDF